MSFSPAILNAVLQHHLQAHNSNAHNQFYVDDGLVSFDSATEGIEQLHTIPNLLSKANFNLHKIVPNYLDINNDKTIVKLDASSVNVLVVSWSISSIFDPMCIVESVTIGMRMLLLESLAIHFDWDTELPAYIEKKAQCHILCN